MKHSDSNRSESPVVITPTLIKTIPMARLRYCIVLFLVSLTIGCGSGDPSDQDQKSDTASAAGSASTTQSPTDVVARFLDEVRRGGEDSQAQSLLTQQAQSVLSKIGHTVQPIGSPDAKFDVTRAEPVPGEKNAALVHSLWSEPAGDGTLQDFQVVWAVEREAAGWRISGLAIEVAPNQPPQIVDFEDGTLMSRLLTSEQPAARNGESAAQVPADSSISR
jgi:hypothetical protein